MTALPPNADITLAVHRRKAREYSIAPHRLKTPRHFLFSLRDYLAGGPRAPSFNTSGQLPSVPKRCPQLRPLVAFPGGQGLFRSYPPQKRSATRDVRLGQKRTFAMQQSMSALGQKRTYDELRSQTEP